jgi:hypothetical protein
MAAFRQRLRRIKVIEGVGAAACGLLVSWLSVFLVDRFLDTPAAVRLGLLIAGMPRRGAVLPAEMASLGLEDSES